MRLTTEQLLEKMESIVKKTVKHYQSDFYDYDVSFVRNFDSEKYDSFYWIVRECGTHFFHENIEKDDVKNNDVLAIRENWKDIKEYQAILIKGTWGFHEVK